ncbi:MAG: disulfide bond formation protein B [Pseudomonadaceae bacterium]|nr:disulfide bond formation protein B [Pseudomonadaceae bacterium]
MGPSFVARLLALVEWVLAAPRRWLAAVLLFALGLIVAAFVLEHGFGVIPCKMCWWQRYVHWAIAAIAAVGVVAPRWYKVWALGIGGAALAGLYVAIWQSGAQVGWWAFPPSCTGWGQALAGDAGDLLAAMARTKVVPCDKEQFRLLGLTLAMWNIPAMVMVVAGILASVSKK